MADFSQLIADVQAVIRENGRQLITGPVLQSTLIEIINTINADKQDPLNIVDALIAGSTDPVTSGAVEAAVSGLGINLANEVEARAAADALLIPKANIVQTLGTATDKVPSVDLLRSQVALLQTAIGAKWTRPTVVSFDDAPESEPIATYNGVDYYSQMDLFDAIVAQGSGGVAADTSVLAALGITPELITGANGAGSAGLIIEQKQNEIFWRSLFVKSENEYDGDYGDYYDFRDGEYWLSFHVERPEGQPETITGYFSLDEGLHRSDIEQSIGISISRVMSQKAVSDALATKADKDTDAVEGNLAQFDSNGNPVDAGEKIGDFAKKDGTYPDLTAGAVLGVPVPAEFAYRGAPYGGSAVVDTVLGNSVKWNQFAQMPEQGQANSWDFDTTAITYNADGSVTLTPTSDWTGCRYDGLIPVTGRKYLCKVYIESEAVLRINMANVYLYNDTPSGGVLVDTIITAGNTGHMSFWGTQNEPFTYNLYRIVDLTAIFGSGNEPSTVSAFEAWMVQQGFDNAYAYNAGQVYGNAAADLKTEDALGDELSTLALNLSTLTGIPEGGSTSEVVFPLGLHSIGGVSDWGKGSEAMRQFKVVDLGDFDWNNATVGGNNIMYSDGIATTVKAPASDSIVANALCSTMVVLSNITYTGTLNSLSINELGNIYIRTEETSEADFKAAMAGVKLVYQLATPVKITLDQPLPALYETADGGPEYIEGPAGTAPTTAPFVGEIRYSQPQADANGLAVAILDALKAASKISSYTFGIDPETSKPAITIS